MIKRITNFIKRLVEPLAQSLSQLQKQHNYEIRKVYTCNKTGKHLLEVKIVNKSQSLEYLAEDIAADDDFIIGFSPLDIRSISYFAACDKYEKILEDENIKKKFQLVRSQSQNGDKTVHVKNTRTGEYTVISLKSFSDSKLIGQLESHDVFQIGYLAGQEQAWKDSIRLKLISSTTNKT